MIDCRALLTLALAGALAADAGGALAGDSGGRVLPDPMFGAAASEQRFGVRPVPPPAPRFGTPKKRRDGVSFTPEFTIRAPSKRTTAAAPTEGGSPKPDGAAPGAAAAATPTPVALPPTSAKPARPATVARGRPASGKPPRRSDPRPAAPTTAAVPKPAPRKQNPAPILAGHGGDPAASDAQTAHSGTPPSTPLAPRRHPHRSEPTPFVAAAAAVAPASPDTNRAVPDVVALPPNAASAPQENAAPAVAATDSLPAAGAPDQPGPAAHEPSPPPDAQLAVQATPAGLVANGERASGAEPASHAPSETASPADTGERTSGAEGASENIGETAGDSQSGGHSVAGANEGSSNHSASEAPEAAGDAAGAEHGEERGDAEKPGEDANDDPDVEAAEDAFDPVWDTPDTEARPDGPTPARLGRMLTALQDDIALGSPDALAAQRVLSRRIAERFRTATPKEWREDANARALVLYGLSGGDPKVVRAVLKRTKLKRPYRPLAAGALAYLEGRASDARRHFAEVGNDTLPHSLRGSVLLARAALNVSEDPAAALALLDEARISAPGTLVEEAALRRAILIASERDDVATFERLVGRYLRAFRTSVYAGNFRQRLAAAITRMTFIRDPAAFGRLEAMLAPMTPSGRQELYLLMARAAIENGNPLAAQTAARRVQDSAAPGSLDNLRARLYQAAAEVVDAPLALSAQATLAAIAAEPLPAADRALLEAAQTLARSVTDLPPPSLASLPGDTADPDAPAAPAISREAPIALDVKPDAEDRWSPPAELEARVADVLTATDELLETTQ